MVKFQSFAVRQKMHPVMLVLSFVEIFGVSYLVIRFVEH
jgi:hypothetical protein